MAVDIRILSETRIGAEKACEHLGTSDEPAHLSTLYRAISPGRASVTGEIVQLGHLRIGGRLMTSVEAIGRYVARLNGVSDEATAAALTPSSRKQDLARARREVEALAAAV
jgi:hypothetical protein